jgi:hypothetical protein
MLLHGLNYLLMEGIQFIQFPAPASTIEEASKRRKAGGRSQKLILYIRGNAISGAPIISGTNQLPNPPIRIGITMKKIITKAWAVMMTL